MSTQDILISLANAANNPVVPLDVTNVTLSLPTPNPDSPRNTQITLMAVPGSGYKGHVVVHYNRLEIDSIEPEQGIRSEDAFTAQAVLMALEPIFGVPLTVDDVEIDLPDLEVGDIAVVTITSKPESLGWQGSMQVVLLHGLPPNSDDLAELMKNIAL